MTVTTPHILQTSVGPRIVLFTGVIQRQRSTIRISSPSSRSCLWRGQLYAFHRVRPAFQSKLGPCSLERSIHIQRKQCLSSFLRFYFNFTVHLPIPSWVTGNEVFFCFHSVISPMCIFVNASWAPLLLRIQAVCGRRKSNQDDHEKRRRLWTSEFTVIQRSECIGRDVCLHSWVVVLAYSSGKRKVWRFAGQRLLLRSF